MNTNVKGAQTTAPLAKGGNALQICEGAAGASIHIQIDVPHFYMAKP